MRFDKLWPILAIAASLLVAEPGRASDTALTAEEIAALDKTIQDAMAEAPIVGIGAAIIVDRKIVFSRGYGFANRAHGVPFTPDTAMNIASITKTITGVALMHAVQEGKLSLDEDINAYLPFKVVNPHAPDERITLRQLATHTSSIVDRWAVYDGAYHYGGDYPESLDDFLRAYLLPGGKNYSEENFLDAKPGTQREYSNIAAALAGRIVEIAVGERLDAYTKRVIFQPLGMRNTGWFLADMDPAKLATSYVIQDGQTIPIAHYGLATYPDGGVRTSVADLSKFFVALLNEGEYDGVRILSKASAKEMLRFQFTAAQKPDNVNIEGEDSVNSGIFWATKYDGKRIGHNGSDPGVRTFMLSDPAREVGVVLFSNTSLSESEMGAFGTIYEALWKQAEGLKKASRTR